jgi:hypothetical protein
MHSYTTLSRCKLRRYMRERYLAERCICKSDLLAESAIFAGYRQGEAGLHITRRPLPLPLIGNFLNPESTSAHCSKTPALFRGIEDAPLANARRNCDSRRWRAADSRFFTESGASRPASIASGNTGHDRPTRQSETSLSLRADGKLVAGPSRCQSICMAFLISVSHYAVWGP